MPSVLITFYEFCDPWTFCILKTYEIIYKNYILTFQTSIKVVLIVIGCLVFFAIFALLFICSCVILVSCYRNLLHFESVALLSMDKTYTNVHINILQGTTPQEKDMQDWMKSLLHKMNSNKTERNIKIFIAKLIVNVEEVSRWTVLPGSVQMLLITSQNSEIFFKTFFLELLIVSSWKQGLLENVCMYSNLPQLLQKKCLVETF